MTADDPDSVARLLWSGVHVLFAIHPSGILRPECGVEERVEAFMDRELRGPTD